MPGQRKNRCFLGRILYNWQNKYNKDGKIVHINIKRWKKIELKNPSFLLDYYDDIIRTIEDFSEKKEEPQFSKVLYIKHFKEHAPIEVGAIHDEGSKYCVIHTMFRIGEIIAIKRKWRTSWPKKRP